MKAKVINGFYSYPKKRIIEKSETIEVEEKRGQELIALGLIEELPDEGLKSMTKSNLVKMAEEMGLDSKGNKAELIARIESAQPDPNNGNLPQAPEKISKDDLPEGGEIDESGIFIVDGKIIGHVEGDYIVITDPETVAETLKDNE